MSNLTAFPLKKGRSRDKNKLKCLKEVMLKSFTFEQEGLFVCVCVCACICILILLLFKGIRKLLKATLSSAKIPEGRSELTAYSCYFPKGTFVNSENRTKS